MPTTKKPDFSIKGLVVPVFLPSLLFATGESGLIPLIPASAEKMGADLVLAGIIAGLVMVGVLLGDFPAVRLVNRFGERRAMIIAAMTASVGILLSVFALNLWMLGAGILLIGATSSVFGLARHGYITEHVPLSHRARSLALLGGMFRGGAFIGPLLGSALVAAFGVQSVYWLAVVFCGAAALVLLWTKPDAMQDTPASGSATVWQIAMRERKKLATLGLASTILGMVRASRIIGLPLWALHIGLDPATTALYVGIAGGLDFLLFYSSGQVMDRFGRRWAAVPTMIALGLTHFVVVLAQDASGFLTVALLMSLANGLGSGVVMVLGADMAPKDARNEFLAAYRWIIHAGEASFPGILAVVTATAGLGAAIVSMGGLSLLGAWLMWRYIPRFSFK